MKIIRISLLALTVLALVSVAAATQRLVPDSYEQIQDAIDAAQNGDTVSVWVPDEPPHTYNENLICNEKSILIVNRSFLPDGGTGYDPSWDHVIIDGSNQIGSVVTMTGSALALRQLGSGDSA